MEVIWRSVPQFGGLLWSCRDVIPWNKHGRVKIFHSTLGKGRISQGVIGFRIGRRPTIKVILIHSTTPSLKRPFYVLDLWPKLIFSGVTKSS
jgi:hypothetical protein